MMRLVYDELLKTFLKKRTFLGFLIVAVVVVVVEYALKLEGGRFLSRTLRSLEQDFIVVGNLFNGWFIAREIMYSLWFHIPLLISFVAGDQFAGEATAGTYRLILTRPVSRSRIFVSKWLATCVYTVSFVFFLGTLSVSYALLLLGGGDMIVFERGILIVPQSDVAWRFFAAYIFATWSMLTIAGIALLFSSFVENAIGPIIATMGVLIVFNIITHLPLELFEPLRPFLFTSYLNHWQKLFLDPLPWGEVFRGAVVLGITTLVSGAAAWSIFNRKDILS
jgi:ABC-2 type transport system permease protein